MVTDKQKATTEPRPLSAEAYTRIRKWLAVRPVGSAYIFTGFSGRGDRGPLTTSIRPVSAWEMVRRYARQIGLDHVKPHDFRRFVGAQLAQQNVHLAQQALGRKRIPSVAHSCGNEELARGITDNLY